MLETNVEHVLGFGFYHDIFDPVSLGYVDTEFTTAAEEGLAEYLFTCMKRDLPMDDMMYGYDLTQADVQEVIEEALDEIF